MKVKNTMLHMFADNIRLKVKALEKTKTKYEASVIKSSIHSDIRKYSDLLMPLQSEAAFYESQKLKIDLTQKNWHNQLSFDPGRKTFHFEHMTPVNHLTDLCIEKPEEIEKILDSCIVVWILKSEDKVLNDLGFRKKRFDPEEVYKKAKIFLKK